MANAEAQVVQKKMKLISELPLYMVVIGVAGVAALLGAELIGLGSLLGAKEVLRARLLQIAFAVTALGAVADFTMGQRYLRDWLKAIVQDWPGLLKFLTITVQLGLLVIVMRVSFLEHSAFYNNVMLLTFYGFIIHYFLPSPYRLPFFLLLSLAGFWGVFGLTDGTWLIGISLALIGICHLPVSFGLRVTILLLAAATLITMRSGLVQTPWTKAVWPILASMFMFRMIVYLYDLKHKKAPIGFVRTLTYFFLLPNVAFPLFPVVDYSTYCRTYYDDDQYRIYQSGLRWLFWGVVHLLLYRYINYYWAIAPEKVQNTSDLVQFMASNYLMIIRITGQFHLIVGILHLFGFNMPRIMDNFLLSTSFTDYWRRVNVYWKEFIQKVFYYPAYFKMRRVGNLTKLVLATCLGFAMTWFLHAYQWFWIRGSFMLTAPDILFWLGMGVCVLANSLYEAKYGRKRALVKRAATLGEIAGKTLRASGIFLVMMTLWSIWTSSSLAEWASFLSESGVTLPGIVAALAVIIATFGVAMLVYERWIVLADEVQLSKPNFFRLATPVAGAIVLLYCVMQPEFSYRLGAQAHDLIADLRTNRLNAREESLLERGYYEKLTNVNQFNTQLSELYAQKPDDWVPLMETDAVRQTGDALKYELVPSFNGSLLNAPFKTNRWGMRDEEYEQTPAPKTYRIAMLGGSVEMGSGVLHEETFEYLLEKRLYRERVEGKYDKYEILNFGVGGYHIIQELMVLENKVLNFKPNAIFSVAHTRDEFRTASYLAEIAGLPIPYDELKEIMQRNGITAGMKPKKAALRLESYKYDIMAWAYKRIVAVCRQHDILPIWICLPAAPDRQDSTFAVDLIRVAEDAGFIVLNLTNVYDSGKGAYLQLAPWDKHPNARGHRLIAEGLYAALSKNDKIALNLSIGTIAKAVQSNGSVSSLK